MSTTSSSPSSVESWKSSRIVHRIVALLARSFAGGTLGPGHGDMRKDDLKLDVLAEKRLTLTVKLHHCLKHAELELGPVGLAVLYGMHG
jgi:hypothetical protein